MTSPSEDGRARLLRWSDVPVLAAALVIGISLPGLVYLFARPLALLVLGFTVAQALSPLADRLEHRLPRALAATLLYLSMFAVVVLLLGSIVPTLLTEGREFAGRAPSCWIGSSSG